MFLGLGRLMLGKYLQLVACEDFEIREIMPKKNMEKSNFESEMVGLDWRINFSIVPERIT